MQDAIIPPQEDTVTNWERLQDQLLSQWGRLTYLEWCRKESARMNANGAQTYVDVEGDLCCIKRK